jgi:hypothetical protein
LKNASSLHFFRKSYLLLLLSFPISFFLPSALPWHPPLTRTMHDDPYDDSKGKSPFKHTAHLSLTLLTLTSSIFALLFLSRSKEMATNIGSLASALDGHGVRLRIGRKGSRKTWRIPATFFFRCTPTPV